MRLLITAISLIFLFGCSSGGHKEHNKSLSPEKLKAIILQSKQSKANDELLQNGERSRSVIRSKKRLKHRRKPETVVLVTHYRLPDTIQLSTIKGLRAGATNPDWSEPLNINLLLSPGSDTLFRSAIILSPDRVLQIGFDNDFFDNTDQFYTNGIRLNYVAPAISDNPVKHILLPYWGKGKNYYGLSLVQNMYTSSTTKKGGILYGDRPYASYLYFGSFKVTNDEWHHYRQTSGLDLGVIGPQSLGGAVQKLFHKYVPYNNEPLGWEYQINTDAVINYNVALEKGIINTEHVQMIVTGTAAIGTLYTNFGGGFNLRLGWFNDYFSDLGIRKKQALKASGARLRQYFFTLRGGARLVGWDASLEGGMINRNSPYTIPPTAISRIVTQTSLGFTVTIGAIGIELEQIVLSPEFNNNWWHAWGHVGLLFAL
ncbi:MAG: lipid A deacylase LpxR family protein [Bacteroidales bacterium]